MPFTIIRQDIVNMDVDAVVSSGNAELTAVGGVSAAIFRAAGEKELTEACRKLAPLKPAQAVATPGFKLKSRIIIHTLGPVYSEYEASICADTLRLCYKNVLELAASYNCESLALPLISSGSFGFPKQAALKIARAAVTEFLNFHDMDIYLTVYGKESFAVSQSLLGQVRSYIDENYIKSHFTPRNRILHEDYCMPCYGAMPVEDSDKISSPNLEDLINKLDESFSSSLLRLIDLKGKTDVEVYKRANMDRKLFSKIRSNPSYSPSKKTVLALAIALELSLSETDALLGKAGFSLSHSIISDVIIEFFIVNKNYNIFELNEVLFSYDQALL